MTELEESQNKNTYAAHVFRQGLDKEDCKLVVTGDAMLVGEDHLVVASLYQPPIAAWLVLRGKTRLLIDNQAMGRVAHLPKLLQPRHVELSEMRAVYLPVYGSSTSSLHGEKFAGHSATKLLYVASCRAQFGCGGSSPDCSEVERLLS